MDSLKNAGSGLTKGVTDTVGGVTNTAGDAVSGVGKTVGDTTSGVGKGVGDVTTGATKGVSDTTKGLGDQGKKLAGGSEPKIDTETNKSTGTANHLGL